MKFICAFPIIILFTLSSFSFAADVPSKTALITGANRGLGLEFARQFKAQGYNVIATARNPSKAAALNKLDVTVEQLDVTNQKSINNLAAKLKGKPIDVLINNAGILQERGKSIRDIDPDVMIKTFNVNSVGPVRVVKSLLPNIEASQEKKIVNISSRLGSINMTRGGGLYYSYGASKAALNHFNRTLANELSSKGVTSVVMHPGWVRTDMGGEHATLSIPESVASMMKFINSLDQSKSGQFYDLYGKKLPW